MHQFEVPIQASIGTEGHCPRDGARIQKDVIAKCYGGDISREKKLLEKQKEGKRRMRQFGEVRGCRRRHLLRDSNMMTTNRLLGCTLHVPFCARNGNMQVL